MSGTRGGLGRIVAMGLGLAVALLLLAAGEARAGKYAVAQCGWFVGADADWADTTGGAKFRSDAFCVPPAGSDPFDGVHAKSLTREGQATVSGTRFARWRWSAPVGTSITQVRGTWWHTLHDGMEQRIGGVGFGGDFNPFLAASTTDVTPRDFVTGFAAPVAAIEDRLLCARAESKSCSLDPGSWSGLRALTITLEDDAAPVASIGGDLLGGGWLRGGHNATVVGNDLGSGLRFGEATLDGSRVGLTEFGCAKASIGGQWRGTQMRPCETSGAASQPVDTTRFSDGPHTVRACVADFAENGGCSDSHTILIDNNAPAHPRAAALAGEEGWRRANDFDLGWENPGQGAASPVAGAGWRLTGPGGYDSGARFAPGIGRTSLNDLSAPAPGAYSLQVWLRDEAGNEDPSSAVTVPLRLDDVPPSVAFARGDGDGIPAQVVAEVSDALSGPAAGSLYYRRADAERWTELAAKLVAADPGKAHLVAPMPELGFGTYLFRAEAVDGAGNRAATALRADGTEMAVRKVAPAQVAKAKTRLFARLRGGEGPGDALTVPFGVPALLSGRLTRADGAGIGGRELRVVSRSSRGALTPKGIAAVRTGERGGFELRLPPGPSRRITVSYPGEAGLEPASRPSLELRVRSGISLRVEPRRLANGEAMRLSGRVRGRAAPIPRRGKLVAIQYLESAPKRWRPVLVTRTDHGGRFRAHYRFRYVHGTASIRLRATALPEERWPYAPGSSRPVTIDVSGR
jgi:hypothetical protein